MPVLPNPRHELFAQELKQTPKISNRIDELLDERERKHAVATEKAIERLALDREGVIYPG